MKFIYITSVLILLFLYNNSYSQKLTNEKDSLFVKKQQMTMLRNQIQKEIDSLKILSADITEKISKANNEIEGLFTKKFGRELGLRIFNKQIWKGMTEKMLLASWGNPDKIDKNIEKWGVFKQYYYGKITFFFKDGKLTDWEE